MKSPSVREDIRRQAVAILLSRQEGLRYSELSKSLHDTMPALSLARIATALHNLECYKPDEVFMPSKGLYKHVNFKDSEVITGSHRARKNGAIVGEGAFYGVFANWLKNEAAVVTHAIPLGGNVFRDRWGTPDVIGKRESKRSDVIKSPTEIVAAEIKVDMLQLLTGFGQACAYRLFSHSSYLVIPRQASEDEIARLEILCEISGIALVIFNRDAPERPDFKVLVRPKMHQPYLKYTNRYLALIEREMFL